MDRFVTYDRTGGISRVTLNRPDLHNAFNDEFIGQITDAFSAAAADDGVRVVVLAAEGKSFCAGGDLNWMQRTVGYTREQNIADAENLARMLRTVRDCPKPVIARVHGAAYGGGVGLVAACDIAVATPKATFCLSEVKLGLSPAVIAPFLLAKIGRGAFLHYGLTARPFDAHEARRIGLISDVVDDEAAMDAWIDESVAAILNAGPAALAACKEIAGRLADMDFDEAQRYTAQRIAELRVSPEGQEGVRAFLEKRKPRWMGT